MGCSWDMDMKCLKVTKLGEGGWSSWTSKEICTGLDNEQHCGLVPRMQQHVTPYLELLI